MLKNNTTNAPAGVGLAGGTGASDGQLGLAKAGDHDHPELHKHHDHHEHHEDAEAGAYVTLAVDFLHNVIDGIGCVYVILCMLKCVLVFL